MTLAVCGGRGGGGGPVACLLLQPATKGRAGWLPLLFPLDELQVGKGGMQMGACGGGELACVPLARQ